MRKYIDIVQTSIPLNESAGLRLIKTFNNDNKQAKVYRDGEWEEYRVKFFKDEKHQQKADYHTNDKQDALDTAQHNIGLKKDIKEAFDDFKDPMFEKEPDEGAEQAENDFQMFKDEGEVGAPDTAKPQDGEKTEGDDAEECEGDDCEEIGKSLNAKDMKAFVGGYKKLCAGAVESISVEEAKELAEIMLALFKSKVEENPIEESNQDNKLAREAEAAGKPAPENPNAPKKPQSPADKRAAVTAAAEEPKVAPTGPKPAPSEAKKADQQAQEVDAEEAKQFVKKKIG